jgi:hypothetical protein
MELPFLFVEVPLYPIPFRNHNFHDVCGLFCLTFSLLSTSDSAHSVYFSVNSVFMFYLNRLFAAPGALYGRLISVHATGVVAPYGLTVNLKSTP